MKHIVLITGFESFNADLYRQAADRAIARCGELEIWMFSDRDLAAHPDQVEAALRVADVFFRSLPLTTTKSCGCESDVNLFPCAWCLSPRWK